MAKKSQTRRFCDCIKKVKKGTRKESAAIGICVHSVLKTKGKTLKKFTCGKKGRVVTQKLKKRGGATPAPPVDQWAVYYSKYPRIGNLRDKLEFFDEMDADNTLVFDKNHFACSFFMQESIVNTNMDMVDIMIRKGAKYADYANYMDDLIKGAREGRGADAEDYIEEINEFRELIDSKYQTPTAPKPAGMPAVLPASA